MASDEGLDLKAPLKLTKLATLSQHKSWSKVWDVAWAPCGSRLATCGADQTICIWALDESSNWKCQVVLEEGHTRTIRRVTWTPDGKCLVAASFDGTVSVWVSADGGYKCVAQLEGHENEVKSVAIHPSEKLLATCSRDKSVWIWEMEDEEEFECVSVLHGHTADVKNVVWRPGSKQLFSCGYDDTIKVWAELEDEDDWGCVATYEAHESTVWDLSFNEEGTIFASASSDNTVRIWALQEDESWKCVCVCQGVHKRYVYTLDWIFTGDDLIATGAGDDAIRIFALESGSPESGMLPSLSLLVEQKHAHESDVNCVKWNPVNQKMLASASDDGNVIIWNLENLNL